MNLEELKNKASKIKLMAFDVDGVFTDGSLIYDENIYTIDGLASQLGQSAENTLAEVRKLISQGYLTGYLLKDNSYLELNTYEKQSKRAVVVKCPSCGAKTKITGTKGFCEYCGESIEVDQ